MKKAALFTILTVLVFGFAGSVLAYEGGTKAVATMTHPEEGETQFSPLLLVPSNTLSPSKPVLSLLRRTPQPTFSPTKIREEKAGPSLGTKGIIRFQEKNRF